MTIAVLHFDGKNVRIKWNIKYEFTFICRFSFSVFPFDVQECAMNISLHQLAGCQPVLDVSTPGGIRVLGYDHTVSTYKVPSPRFSYIRNGDYVVGISAKVLLYREFQSYMLTTFLPCGILIALSNSTLMGFLLKNFSDRIMVTLSLLIVVASLFSQVVSTLPSSVDIKYVDVYFFYCIVRLSFIYILHSISGKMSLDPHEGEGDSKHACTLTKVRCRSRARGTSKVIAWTDEEAHRCLRAGRKGSLTFDRFGSIFLVLVDAAFLVLTAAVILQVRSEVIRKFEANNRTDMKAL